MKLSNNPKIIVTVIKQEKNIYFLKNYGTLNSLLLTRD